MQNLEFRTRTIVSLACLAKTPGDSARGHPEVAESYNPTVLEGKRAEIYTGTVHTRLYGGNCSLDSFSLVLQRGAVASDM